jgi:hypothetical protein
MPAGGGEIIREFLVGLGFSVNDTQLRSFNYAINRVASITLGSMNRMAAGVAIAGASVAADVLLIASSLQKMYYTSKLSGATVANLKSIQEGAKQVGISAEQMTSAITDFGFKLKTSYSLRYLVQGLLGVKTEGRDTSDVVLDMVDALGKLPPQLAAIYEGILGLDPQTFFLLAQGADQFRKSTQETRDQLKASGVDLDEEARKAKELENRISELKRQWDLLSYSMENWAIGPATKAVSYLNWLSKQKNFNMWDNPEAHKPGQSIRNTLKDLYFWEPSFMKDPGMPPGLKGPGGPPNLQGMSMQDKVRQYAKMFGLPEDLMMRLVKQESGFNPRATSKVGAKGLMQLMDKTGAAYGVTDPYNPDQNLAGGMQYFSELLKQFGGDVNLALAAYNAGPDAVIKHDALHKYKETREYVNAINGTKLGAGGAGSGVTINSKTDIHVNGAGDPKAVAGNVAAEQKRVDADNLRNAKGVVD